MKTGRIVWVMVAVLLSSAPSPAVMAAANVQLAQADFGARMGPARSPDVVIEEPRPPRAVIETEGRGEPHKCRSVNVTEWRDGEQVTRTERECDEP
jgi:hypothetical protein